MVEFFFTEDQRDRAYREAWRRQALYESMGRKGRNKGPEHGRKALELHVLGAGGEMAVAVYLGLEQHVFSDIHPVRGSSDLPGKIDVKCRPCHKWDLLVQLDDDLDKNFVLVTMENKRTFIHGWIHGSMIEEGWIREYSPGRPCYSIPQSKLYPIQELKCQTEAA